MLAGEGVPDFEGVGGDESAGGGWRKKVVPPPHPSPQFSTLTLFAMSQTNRFRIAVSAAVSRTGWLVVDGSYPVLTDGDLLIIEEVNGEPFVKTAIARGQWFHLSVAADELKG